MMAMMMIMCTDKNKSARFMKIFLNWYMYCDDVLSYVTCNVHTAIKIDTANLYSYILSKVQYQNISQNPDSIH